MVYVFVHFIKDCNYQQCVKENFLSNWKISVQMAKFGTNTLNSNLHLSWLKKKEETACASDFWQSETCQFH